MLLCSASPGFLILMCVKHKTHWPVLLIVTPAPPTNTTWLECPFHTAFSIKHSPVMDLNSILGTELVLVHFHWIGYHMPVNLIIFRNEYHFFPHPKSFSHSFTGIHVASMLCSQMDLVFFTEYLQKIEFPHMIGKQSCMWNKENQK